MGPEADVLLLRQWTSTAVEIGVHTALMRKADTG